MSENRLIELETKMAYQEDVIEELGKTVFSLYQKLEKLETRCDDVTRKLTLILSQNGLDINEHDQTPPHY